MDGSIVCISEFISKYKIQEEVYARFLPCERDVYVASQEVFERFRDSRKRRAFDDLENHPMGKKSNLEGCALSTQIEHLSATLDTQVSSLSVSKFFDKSVPDTSFEILESSFLLCSDEMAAQDISDVQIIQSSEFQPLDSEFSSPPRK
ncbi:LAFA_0F21286g1_1 [Lachancea sp. 'fantastica']|nr:LAFA_0F21286g1_1 [Lachancea sp. 'fantastica']